MTDTASRSNTDLERLAGSLGVDLEHFRRRVVQDALQEATAAYWTRRAKTFAGVGTPACDEIARACANAAAFHRWRRDHNKVVLEVAG